MSSIGKGRQTGRQFLKNVRDRATDANKGLDLYFVTVASIVGDLVTVTASVGGGSSRQVARAKGPNIAIGDRGLLIETAGGGMVFIPTGGVDDHKDVGANSMKIGAGASTTLRGHAIGVSSIAGDAATALGYGAEATGYIATALGFASKASGQAAISIGYQMSVSGGADGLNSIAIGWAALAATEHSIAIGTDTIVSGIRGVAIGHGATAGELAVALGRVASAMGTGSVALGITVSASGIYTTVVGYAAAADAGYGIAIGYQANAGYSGNSYGEIAIGRGASTQHANGVALGNGATTQQHYDGVINVSTLRINPTARAYSKLGLKSPNGTQYYLWISDTGVVTVNTSW